MNNGVIEGRLPTDFVAGVLPYEVRNETGDWTPYLTKSENQYSSFADTMACVSFSCNHSIEIQQKFLTGVEVNYSNRWLAKMSNTTPEGNYLSIVADTARNKGAVTEEFWPDPGNYTWDQYYAELPQATQDKGLEFLKHWSIAYEWVDVGNVAEIRKALKQAPLQVVLPGHAVVEILNMNDYFRYFDSYSPYLKDKPQNTITDALKIVLTRKDTMKLVNDNGTTYLVGSKGKIGVADAASENLLKQLDDVEIGSTAGIPQKGTLTHDDAFIIHK